MEIVDNCDLGEEDNSIAEDFFKAIMLEGKVQKPYLRKILENERTLKMLTFSPESRNYQNCK